MSLPQLAHRLRLARTARQLTVEQTAELIGLTPGAIRHHENSIREPTVRILKLYSRVYHVSCDWLLGGVGKGPADPESFTDEAMHILDEIPGDRQKQAVDILRTFAGRK